MQSMVEGQVEISHQTPRTPLHHFVVPLPVPGRIA
jgi:hypothetical protein